MITEQVITYIKDQLARGISRDKIKSNLLAAGWMQEDVDQAFSFASPQGQSAALKIAPAFAVENPEEKEIPVDKTTLTQGEEGFRPILKRDPEPATSSFTAMPVEKASLSMEAQSTNLNPQPAASAFETAPLVNTQMAMPAMAPNVQTMASFESTSTVRPMSPLRTVKTSPKTSGFLKALAFLLFAVLVGGNAYLWLITAPAMEKSALNTEQLPLQETTNTQEVRMIPDATFEESNLPEENATLTSQGANLEIPVRVFQNAAASYFAKNSSYGTKAAVLVSCDSAGGVFADPGVKKNLSDISALANTTVQCSLAADDASKARMTSYLVYVPLGTGGYCADSTGAALMVSKQPTGTFCAEAI